MVELGDGTMIHYEASGEGPQVLLANLLYGHPSLFAGLVSDLSSDHRVITYDLRGTGRSSRHGPYELAVDMADLEAVLEHFGGVRVIVAIGDAPLRAVRMAAARPDLVDLVVTPGTFLLASSAEQEGGTRGLSGSGSVMSALLTLLEADYRAGMRSIVESGNPDLPEDDIRERVDRVVTHCPREAALSRLRAWVGDDAIGPARALGDRLWILPYAGNPWFPEELADRIPEFLPDAHYETVVDGPMSRPDQTAAVVRRITASTGDYPKPSHR